MSRPPRARGSKQYLAVRFAYRAVVAPTTGAWIETSWQRGGKQSCLVAPTTGAWIETLYSSLTAACRRCRAHHGRVDRNRYDNRNGDGTYCRAHHGRVDRNWFAVVVIVALAWVAPTTGAWIETFR